jgi:L-iditol 2-dehydrogenase
MHGVQSVGLSLGRGAVVCGAGPIGLIALVAARASGAHPIVITDLEPKRLAFAKKFVPSALTYQVDRNLDAESNSKAIRKLFNFECVGEYGAPEVVLECTGVESSVVTAAYTARRGGTVMVIGVGREIMNNIPFMHLSLGEVSCFTRNTQLDSDSSIDRPQVYQQVPRYVACWPSVPRWRYP